MKSALRAAIGAVAGAALWIWTSPAESRLLGALANFLYRIVGSDTHLWLTANVARISSGRAIAGDGGSVRVDLLTFNAIVLVILIALSIRSSRRDAVRLAMALGLVLLVHLFGLIATVNSTILATLVAQKKEVSAVAWNVWFGLSQGYAIVLGYALVFAIWWGLFRRSSV